MFVPAVADPFSTVLEQDVPPVFHHLSGKHSCFGDKDWLTSCTTMLCVPEAARQSPPRCTAVQQTDADIFSISKQVTEDTSKPDNYLTKFELQQSVSAATCQLLSSGASAAAAPSQYWQHMVEACTSSMAIAACIVNRVPLEHLLSWQCPWHPQGFGSTPTSRHKYRGLTRAGYAALASALHVLHQEACPSSLGSTGCPWREILPKRCSECFVNDS